MKCADKLAELDKRTIFCVLIPRKPKNAVYDIDPAWLAVREDELDKQGFPTEDTRLAFENLKADVMIDLTRAGDFVMHYLQLLHTGSFKVGTQSFLNKIFDLTVTRKDRDELSQFFEHILFYLRTIRSN
jgi:hypothetical protein